MVDSALLLRVLEIRLKSTIAGWLLIHRCCHKLFKHTNMESCSSVKSIKYIYKYINKGSDQTIFGLQNEHDEMMIYQSGRYISTSEEVWPILSFPIHELFPPSNVFRKTILLKFHCTRTCPDITRSKIM